MAKLATLRSRVAAPISKTFSSIFFIKENSFPSFITTPLTPLSLNKVLDPAPKIVIFKFFLFASLRNSFK